jgi:hypothetical protein|nr:MAG: hypothetical protein [Caudoviricetes sp.]
MLDDNLTHDNFLLYAARHYISPHYIEQEFFSDLKRIKYTKRLIQKYIIYGDLKERLILNHIISTYNVFDTEPCTKMLFLKLGQKNYSPLKTFLVYLNCMPEVVFNVEGKNIISSDITIDFNIANKLRTL